MHERRLHQIHILDPMRVLALSPPPAVCEAILDYELESRNANDFFAHVKGALTQDLGTTPVARSAWQELSDDWIQRAGWQTRIASWGSAAIALWLLLPWMIAAAWVLLLRRRTPSESIRPRVRLTRFGVLLVLALPLITIDKFNLGPFLIPFWFLATYEWLSSDRCDLWQKATIFLLLGTALYAGGTGLSVLPTVAVLGPWANASHLFGLIFLGYLFCSQPQQWKIGYWLPLLLVLALVPVLGAMDPGLALVAFIVLCILGFNFLANARPPGNLSQR